MVVTCVCVCVSGYLHGFIRVYGSVFKCSGNPIRVTVVDVFCFTWNQHGLGFLWNTNFLACFFLLLRLRTENSDLWYTVWSHLYRVYIITSLLTATVFTKCLFVKREQCWIQMLFYCSDHNTHRTMRFGCAPCFHTLRFIPVLPQWALQDNEHPALLCHLTYLWDWVALYLKALCPFDPTATELCLRC